MIAFSRSSSAAPPEEWIFDLAAGKSRQLTHIADPRVDPDSMPTSEVVTYQSFDGTLISAVLTMPRGVLRNGRNPAVVEVHGGPMDQARDGYDRTAAALATQGFIVIQPNYRGSQGYGRAFQNGNRGDLGGADLRDVVIAKDFLVATGFVDSGRVGIVGGSYGGYMTLMALGKANEAFAAGVQYFGVVDWALYMESADARLRGIFQDLLGDDPRAWITSSPSHYLDRVRVPLLSLQGDNDIRVPRSQAEMVEARLKAGGVTAETVFYPDEGHSFAREATRLDALRRTVDWFRRYLVAKDAR
jgi:dipeptidyl aminopeptidase/acylaminoacyl peptidase